MCVRPYTKLLFLLRRVRFFFVVRSAHPCPNDDYVRVTCACDWPEHPCRHDDNVRDRPCYPCVLAAKASIHARTMIMSMLPKHPCLHDAWDALLAKGDGSTSFHSHSIKHPLCVARGVCYRVLVRRGWKRVFFPVSPLRTSQTQPAMTRSCRRRVEARMFAIAALHRALCLRRPPGSRT